MEGSVKKGRGAAAAEHSAAEHSAAEHSAAEHSAADTSAADTSATHTPPAHTPATDASSGIHAALRESEERYRLLYEQSNDAIMLLADGGFVDCNPRTLGMFGLPSRESFIGHHPAEFSPPTQADGRDSMEAAEVHIRAALRNGVDRFEWRHMRANGEVFPADVLLSSFEFRGAHFLQATVRDISLRRHAEEALERSRQRLALTVRASNTGLWDWDLQTNEVYFSPEWKGQLGFSDDELANDFAEWEARLHPDDHDQALKVTLDFIARPWADFENEFRLRHKDGSYRWIMTRAAVERDEKGESRRMFGLHIDITDRKTAEEELRRKTLQLEELNRELEAFSYSVSHDLRAPLRHISGFVELLQNAVAGQLDEKSLRWLAIIADAARDMGVMIDDLLVFSRMGRTEMLRSEVDMRRLADEVIDTLRSEIGDRQVEWDLRELPRVQGDPSMLKLVLQNLFSNAVKYSRTRETARITLECVRGEDECEFRVTDNGVGFDMKYVDKLFGVFQRLHSAREYEGTGIGLANVRRIILRHGGRVWAEGLPGRGATFHFTLPHIA